MASTISYIINFNKTTGVYTLTSTKDEVKVDAKHKKYEWLKSQEAGRIVKISDKGRWNSSKDYNGLYDEINSSSSKKKTSTVQTKTKSVDDKSSEVNELKTQLKELQTLNNKLKTENSRKPFQFLVDITLDIFPKKDYDYIFVNVIDENEKTLYSSKFFNIRYCSDDWNGLRHVILDQRPKKIIYLAFPLNEKGGLPEKVEITPESNGLDIESLRLIRRKIKAQTDKNWNYQYSRNEAKDKIIQQLKKENQLLKKKVVSVKTKPKPKPIKKQPKRYKARMTATLSFTDFFKKKVTEFLPYIEIYTEKLDKKPSQSFFKTYCKLVENKGYAHSTYKFGMPIKKADGFKMYKIGSLGKNVKITNISFKSIEEY